MMKDTNLKIVTNTATAGQLWIVINLVYMSNFGHNNISSTNMQNLKEGGGSLLIIYVAVLSSQDKWQK